MNIYYIPPLLATIAYIPLLGVLLANRPWNRQQRLFAWFLITALLWSLGNILGRSDFFMSYKLLMSKIAICSFALAAVQFHVFISSFYPRNKGRWLPLAYTSLAITIFLVAIDYVPKDIIITGNKIYPVYGYGVFFIGLPLAILTVRNVYFLWRRRQASDDPMVRNQIVYLLLSIGILTFAVFATFIPWGNEFSISHIGNLINAVILTYAVLRYRLLDVSIVFRRGVAWIGSVVVGVVLYLFLFLLIYRLTDVKLDVVTVVLTILAAIAISASVYLLQGFFSRRADRLFYRVRYDYLQKLHDFLRHKLTGIFSLKELSGELLPLIAGALDCEGAYLLLPEP
jgi:hypothetical protein